MCRKEGNGEGTGAGRVECSGRNCKLRLDTEGNIESFKKREGKEGGKGSLTKINMKRKLERKVKKKDRDKEKE